ncbi:MAG: acyl carrier protein [Pseudomonadota bacterium]|nr:acyl carrier protein [Pseudomonadota bacterium]
MNDIDDRVMAAVCDALLVERSQVVPTASLLDDLHGDSLKLVEMIMTLEEEFDIDIPDEDAETLATVQQAIDYVQHAVNGGAD